MGMRRDIFPGAGMYGVYHRRKSTVGRGKAGWLSSEEDGWP
jgi:hypothetical protein